MKQSYDYRVELFKGGKGRQELDFGTVEANSVDDAISIIDDKVTKMLLNLLYPFDLLGIELPFIELRWEFLNVGQGHYINTDMVKQYID